MLSLNDSFGVRTRQIPRLSPNGRNRRYPVIAIAIRFDCFAPLAAIPRAAR